MVAVLGTLCLSYVLFLSYYPRKPHPLNTLSARALRLSEARYSEPAFRLCIEEDLKKQVTITRAIVSLCIPVPSSRVQRTEKAYKGSGFSACLKGLTPVGGAATEGNFVLCESGRTPSEWPKNNK